MSRSFTFAKKHGTDTAIRRGGGSGGRHNRFCSDRSAEGSQFVAGLHTCIRGGFHASKDEPQDGDGGQKEWALRSRRHQLTWTSLLSAGEPDTTRLTLHTSTARRSASAHAPRRLGPQRRLLACPHQTRMPSAPRMSADRSHRHSTRPMDPFSFSVRDPGCAGGGSGAGRLLLCAPSSCIER